MIVVVILAIWAALAAAMIGLVLGALFWAISLIVPPAFAFGAMVSIAAFPCFYMFFAQRV